MLTSRLAAHPRRTLLAVLLFVVLAGAVGGPVAGALESSGGFVAPGADSEVAVDRIEAATGVEPGPGIVLLVEDPSPDRLAAIDRELANVPGVASTAPGGRAGDDALVTATLKASADEEAVAEDALAVFARADGVTVGGGAVAGLQIGETVGADLGRAELIAFPLLLLLSLLFFRGRATLMPLAVGVTTVLGTFLVLSLVNRVYGLSVFALNLVIGLGLGLAIDYTLFLVTRFREELARQGAGRGAIATTMATAGRTVAFSAATVSAALITLVVFPQDFLKSMGIAGAIVGVVAALASLVIAPALFAIWGDKLARGRSAADDGAAWHRLAHAVMRRAKLIAPLTALAMLALSLPALSVAWSAIDSSVIPEGKSARTVADAVNRGEAAKSPMVMAVSAPRDARAEVQAFADRVAGVDGVERVAPVRDLGSGTWQVSAIATGDPSGPAAQDAVSRIRAIPAPFDVKVGGGAAEFVDQQAAIGSRLLLAAGLLVGLTLLVLWLMTGSLVLPVKAVIMNALTVGTALTPLVLIYQGGHLTGLLGYTPNGGVEPSDFLVTAAIVFALSTDYGVFLLGRIKEARDGGLPDAEAVATGLARTGRVVTAAAILMAVAIGAFSTSSISFIQQIGVATATGVLVDAFVVRTLLVPSLMTLLGRWNWWAPAPLRRLHGRIGLREGGPQLAVR
ncbi:MAG TPA: MMPL family transporter [Solirubrobacteraceae bacterium]|nr:MMPL family transporter [Solirubrobacteraceae bacterium]